MRRQRALQVTSKDRMVLSRSSLRPTPPTAGYGDTFSHVGQPWPGSQTERLAQNTAPTEVIRPGVPAAQGTQPSNAQPTPESANRLPGVASPFDPSQFRLPTLGLPPGLGTPEATPEIKREYGQFVEREIAPENTIQVVVGRAKVIVLREKPRRIYIPDETVAGFQIVTDRQFAVVGKKVGRTVLNLWFPDPRDPNDPNKDRTLSYMIVVLPDPERAALDVLQERKRLEAQVTAFQQALKVLEREIKEAFPDSAVQLSLVGDQVVVRGESKDVIEAAQILRIVAQHTPSGRRTKVDSNNVNVTFIPGLGDEQAAVNAIREIMQGSPDYGQPPASAGRTAGHAHGHGGRSESHRGSNHRHGFQHCQRAIRHAPGHRWAPYHALPWHRAPRRLSPPSAGTFLPQSTTVTCLWRSRPCEP